MTTQTLTPDYLEQLGKEYLRNEAEIARLTEMNAGIKARMLKAQAAGLFDKTGTFGPVQVSYRAGARTLDAKKLEATYPFAQFPTLYSHKLDTTAVKGAFAPNELAAFQKQGAASVTIKATA